MISTQRFGLAAVIVCVATGCAAESDREPSAPAASENAGADDGLTLVTNDEDHVAGTLERDGSAIAFDLSREGSQHHVVITSASGAPILSSTLVSGVDTTVYFGGRATVTGQPRSDAPTQTGDATVFDDLNAMPEGQLIPKLHDALRAAHVDEDLFHLDTSGDLAPKALLDWVVLNPWNSVAFGSWSFWGTTRVTLGNYANYSGGYYRARFQANTSSSSETVSGYGNGTYSRSWWGARITVTNTNPGLCTVYGDCSSVRMWVRAD